MCCCTVCTVYSLIGCLFELRSVTLLPHVSSVIFLTLYLVCMFFFCVRKDTWKSLWTVECAKFFVSPYSGSMHGNMDVSALVSVAVNHSYNFLPRNLPFVRPNGPGSNVSTYQKKWTIFAILIGFECTTVSWIIATDTTKTNKRFKFIINVQCTQHNGWCLQFQQQHCMRDAISKLLG